MDLSFAKILFVLEISLFHFKTFQNSRITPDPKSLIDFESLL